MSKFSSLKEVYDFTAIPKYEFTFVFDDDCVFESGSLINLLDRAVDVDIEVLAPAQSSIGRVSHKIMSPVEGHHTFRFTNFVEMNYVVFSRFALAKFMVAYDKSVPGWGVDWWYANVLGFNTRRCCGICDDIVVINPHHHMKDPDGLISNLINIKDNEKCWLDAKTRLDLKEWPHKNVGYIYDFNT
jgi:hypothetical protein